MTKYKLPFKTRLVLKVMSLFRPTRHGMPNAKDLARGRWEWPRFFLVNWILGKPDKRCLIEEIQVPVRWGTVRAKRYQSRQLRPGAPAMLNLHGGGWCVGNLQNNDYYCAYLAAEIQGIVVSLDYRLAPEHRFPAGLEDCYDALVWMSKQAGEWGIDPNRIGVTGDSAGGNLSAALCLMSRDLSGPKIACQALIYPATDARLGYQSLETHAQAPILRKMDILNFLEMYIGKPEDRQHPYLSPYLAERLVGLPPAYIITAGYDPLVDDGKQYGERLAKEGVPVTIRHYPEDIHGFVTLVHVSKSGLEATRDVVKWIVETLRVD